ncbi:hypothetical protein FUAX_51990 (plasmid) [Fulvitalea axinellae]|uniref:Uncharacterized protein n=1 Tax=Fulvitalea axinellae TaxID=1182444 RepID=A0AAU9D0U0_9BACT|nr:hypothetical protein FUAX_51990 [Fulvitalea axinellae]
MENQYGILKTKQDIKALDFSFLKQVGMAFIQSLTEGVNIDSNLSVLDQLCYVLSDMANRTGLDVKKLLTYRKNESETSFLPPFEILSGTPVTVNHWRKLIIDRVERVRNVWFDQLGNDRPDTVSGLYILRVELAEGFDKKLHGQRIKEEIYELLAENRNLGEDVCGIVIQDPQELFVDCEIVLEDDCSADDVHAQVLARLNDYITRPLKRYTLQEAKKMGMSADEIFEGPALRCGLILDHDLRTKDSYFQNGEFINLLADITGIKSIKRFNLLVWKSGEGYVNYTDRLEGKEKPEAVAIGWMNSPRLASIHLDDINNPLFFKYFKKGSIVSISKEEVFSNLERLRDGGFPLEGKSVKKRKETTSSDKSETEKRQQNCAPELLQLKGFMMLFEHLMSNHLSEINNFGKLYSLDPELETAYLAQVPIDIVYLGQLLDSGDSVNLAEVKEKIIRRIDDLENRRLTFLRHLMVRFGEDYHDLPFHKFDFYPGHKAQTEVKPLAKIVTEQRKLSSSKSLSPLPRDGYWLRENYSVLERRIRLKLDLPLRPSRFASSLFPKVAFHKPSSEKPFPTDYKLFTGKSKLTGIKDNPENIKEEVNRFLLKDIEIDEDLFRKGIFEDNYRLLEIYSRKYNYTVLLFRSDSNKSTWLEKVKGNDFYPKNYSCNTSHLVITSEDRVSFVLESLDDSAGNKDQISVWRTLAIYSKKSDATLAVFSLKNLLIDWNYQSEGLYVLDHTLLRHRHRIPFVGVTFKCRGVEFSIEPSVSPEELQETVLVTLLKMKKENGGEFSVELERHERYGIQLYKDGHPEGKLYGNFPNLATSIKALEKMEAPEGCELRPVEIFKNEYRPLWTNGGETLPITSKVFYDNKKDPDNEKALYYAREVARYAERITELDVASGKGMSFYYKGATGNFPAKDYNGTLTVLLPGWTARFADCEFRRFTENALRNNTPSHLTLRIKWISLNEMTVFEKIYSDWIYHFWNVEQATDYKAMNHLSDELMSFLQGDYKLDSPKDVERYFKARQRAKSDVDIQPVTIA